MNVERARIPKVIHRVIEIGEKYCRPAPNVVRLRGPIYPSLKIGPLSLAQWEDIFCESVGCTELINIGFTHLDTILALTQEKMTARYGSKLLAQSYFIQFAGITSRIAAEKLGVKINDISKFGLAFILIRHLIARANLLEDLTSSGIRETIDLTNKFLEKQKIDLRVIP